VAVRARPPRRQDRSAAGPELAEDVEHGLADEPVAAFREPLRQRLARWRRRHPALVTGTAALIFTALVAVGVGGLLLSREQARTVEEQRDKLAEKERAEQAHGERVRAQVPALLSAAAQAVPALLEALAPYRAEVLPRLRQVRRESPSPQQRTRAALALLPDDPGQAPFLLGRLLDEKTEPDEVVLIRDRLAGRGKKLAPELWRTAAGPKAQPAGRFPALVARARFDPKDRRRKKAA